MRKKYELLKDDTKVNAFGVTLYRIRALVAVGSNVAPSQLGGYIEKEENLSHSGDAWVYGNAMVSGDALVYGNARVYGDALVYGNAWVLGDALVSSRSDWLLIGPAKSSGRFTTAFKDSKVGVRVVCGCFSGTIEEFYKQIETTHKDNKEYLEQYRLFCQLIAFNFGLDNKQGEK